VILDGGVPCRKFGAASAVLAAVRLQKVDGEAPGPEVTVFANCWRRRGHGFWKFLAAGSDGEATDIGCSGGHGFWKVGRPCGALLAGGGGVCCGVRTPGSEARPSCARGAALHKIKNSKRGEGVATLGAKAGVAIGLGRRAAPAKRGARHFVIFHRALRLRFTGAGGDWSQDRPREKKPQGGKPLGL